MEGNNRDRGAITSPNLLYRGVCAHNVITEGVNGSMAFPAELTSVLTGASMSQLSGWRTAPALITPELQTRPRALYSFRDIVALRTFVRLRKDLSLQKIRFAMATLQDYDLTDHPSNYQLVTDSKTVFLVEGERAMDLVKKKGQEVIASMADVFAPFTNYQGDEVVDFRQPRQHIEVREKRMGGWPTIAGTRVPYNTIALLLSDGTVPPEDAEFYYPNVSALAAMDATDFDNSIRSKRRSA